VNESETDTFMPSIVSIARDKRYIGQKVQTVLDATGKHYDDHLFVDLEPGYLSGAAFHFEEEGWLYFYVDENLLQPTFNPDRKWDIGRFKEEKIARMEWEED
jgi:hypothetical protein